MASALPNAFPLLPTARESSVNGKELRKVAPRKSWSSWTPAPDRPDVIDLLASQETTRIPEVISLRHERMAVSESAFFRGNALGMAADLASAPRSGITVQTCGDAHIGNFGGFAAPDRHLVFDINDFDETLPGPWEWDLARLATSVEICCRARGFDAQRRTSMVSAVIEVYRNAMLSFAQKGNLDVWYARLDVEDLLGKMEPDMPKHTVDVVRDTVDKAKQKDSSRAATKLTRIGEDGKLHIISDPPLVVPLGELVDREYSGAAGRIIDVALHLYKETLPRDRRFLLGQYDYVDCARKVVGVGSVGMRCWIIVLQGHDASDPLVLQMKEAAPSVMERYVRRSLFPNHGQRVVEGQRLMQAAGDELLGWSATVGVDGRMHDFYVRQLWDWKMSPDLDMLPEDLIGDVAQACAWTLARAHARSGNRFAIAGYLGGSDSFDRSMAVFASTYADVNAADYARFKETLGSTAGVEERRR